ncbi:MAG: thiamine pyrophosphate-binding protein [Christensenellaceae bacterium]|jgi:acetolactate synthase-1/2/3 large subunit
MLKLGSEIIIECLLEQDVSTVFGYPGGSILPVYEALSCYADRIRHVLLTHEQHAAHAADGYARASGRVGVVLATSGPGATNLLTGLSAAYIDSIPVVAITCNVERGRIGTDGFQEADIFGISMPVTKHNYLVRSGTELASTLREAFCIARSGRPGPVLIDIPVDITQSKYVYIPEQPLKIQAVPLPAEKAQNQAVQLLKRAKKPLILAGGGVRDQKTVESLYALSSQLCAPIVQTLMGVSKVSGVGFVGQYGEVAANELLQASDTVLAVGTRFSERSFPSPEVYQNKQIIQIDIDAAEINKNIMVNASLVGDAKDILPLLQKSLKQTKKPWAPLQAKKEKASCALTPAYLLQTLTKTAATGQIYTTEVGQHQLWAAKYLNFEKNDMLLTSGGFGAMGYGLGAAIGAHYATGKRIINIAGDGSFYMNLAELSTLAYYNLPITIVLLNNASLGLVRELQEDAYQNPFAVDFARQTDFIKLAEAFGIHAHRIEAEREVEKIFTAASHDAGPNLIECPLPQILST